MTLKICCLILCLAVAGTNCAPFRFGGSAGASSNSSAGVSGRGTLGHNEDGGFVTGGKGKVFGDWTGTAGAGGYAGESGYRYDPKSEMTGIGGGGMVTSHLGASTGLGAGGVYKNGKVTADGELIGTLDKSIMAKGNGFLGSVQQWEGEDIAGYGNRVSSSRQDSWDRYDDRKATY